MDRRVFIFYALATAIETFLFNESIFNGQYLFSIFWLILLVRKLFTSFIATRVARTIDDITKTKG
jgi:hypothetical protein